MIAASDVKPLFVFYDVLFEYLWYVPIFINNGLPLHKF